MISEERWDRLVMHLEKVEKLGRLRTSPKGSSTDCPIHNFAPIDWGYNILHPTYEIGDSAWWVTLPEETKCKVTKRVQEWIKERYNGDTG